MAEGNKCDICEADFRNVEELILHVNRIHNHKRARYSSEPRENQDKTNNTDNFVQIKVKNEFECNLCGKTFSTKQNMERHVRNLHESLNLVLDDDEEAEEKKSKSPPVTTSTNLVVGPQVYQCFRCDYVTSNATNFKKHEKNQINPLKICSLCPFKSCSKRGYLNHCKSHGQKYVPKVKVQKVVSNGHNNEIDNKKIEKITATVSENGQILNCELCDKSYDNIHYLKRHIKTVHDKVKDYKCDSCGKAFTTPSHLEQHVKSVHLKIKDIACDYCDKVFSARFHLNKHVKYVHKKLKNYRCGFCSRAFHESSHLKRHIKSIHKGQKVHTCGHCKKSFGAPSHLKRHVNLVHKKLKDFKCEICAKMFSTLQNLERHIRTLHEDIDLDFNLYDDDEEEKKVPLKVVPDFSEESDHEMNNDKQKNIDKALDTNVQEFSTRDSLDTNVSVKVEIELELKTYYCDCCHQMFFKLNCLYEHIVHVHEDIKKDCLYCLKPTTQENGLCQRCVDVFIPEIYIFKIIVDVNDLNFDDEKYSVMDETDNTPCLQSAKEDIDNAKAMVPTFSSEDEDDMETNETHQVQESSEKDKSKEMEVMLPYRYPCVVSKTCDETFKTDKEIEDHVHQKHSDAKLSRVDVNELLLVSYQNKESERLKTFKNCWPNPAISIDKLANAGFIYTRRGDSVQCAYCAGVIGDWEDNDDPMTEHKNTFPKCPKFSGNSKSDVKQASAPQPPSISLTPKVGGVYQCSRCDFVTAVSSNFKKHEKHQDAQVKICSLCHFKSCSERGYLNHCKTHGQEAVPILEQEVQNVNKPSPKIKVGGPEVFQCFRCDYVTSNLTNFKKHEKNQTNPVKICSLCSFKSCSDRGYLNHCRSHGKNYIDTLQEVSNGHDEIEKKKVEKNVPTLQEALEIENGSKEIVKIIETTAKEPDEENIEAIEAFVASFSSEEKKDENIETKDEEKPVQEESVTTIEQPDSLQLDDPMSEDLKVLDNGPEVVEEDTPLTIPALLKINTNKQSEAPPVEAGISQSTITDFFPKIGVVAPTPPAGFSFDKMIKDTMEVEKEKTPEKEKEKPADDFIKFTCVVYNTCEETFKTDKELEDHVHQKHSDAKLTKVDVNELLLARYKGESKRLMTFMNCWPNAAISPEKIAKAGFIYTRRGDSVQCAFCAGVIGDWEDNDDPMTEHKKTFPNCPKVVRDSIKESESEENGTETPTKKWKLKLKMN